MLIIEHFFISFICHIFFNSDISFVSTSYFSFVGEYFRKSLNHFLIPQALASMSMHKKLNICALIKQAIFPH